jgi:uncharacterized membrane protein
MSFREKSAWISFLLTFIFGGLWLRNVVRVEFYGLRQDPVKFVFVMLLAIILAEIGLHIALAIQSPREARTPKDEREKLIDLKASRVAFYVLMVGAWTSVGTLHLPNSSRFLMAQFLMGTIIITLLVRFATQIALYRRDA